MNNYTFTKKWFEETEDFNVFENVNEELHLLEIGSYEGNSTIWLIENILLNKKSTITCIDTWKDFSQDTRSLDSYDTDDAEWKTGSEKIEDTFLKNIKNSNQSNKVIIHKGFSHEILPQLIVQNKKYDLIFIDGNHTSPFVLTDAIFSWYLLKSGGFMIFDDYIWKWKSTDDDTQSPKLAIDSFIYIYRHYLKILYDKRRKAIIKL